MRALLIINPVSGDKTPNSEKVPQIQQELAGTALDVAYTTEERSAGDLAREGLANGYEAILAGGGDGTISEVAKELAHKKVPLGIIPIGTFNNISRSIGIPADIPDSCRIISEGFTREIDIGRANDGQLFFEAVGIGLDATLFPLGEEIKGGHWSRAFSALKLTFEYRRQPIVITFDRTLDEAADPKLRPRLSRRAKRLKTIKRNALLAVAANGPYYGGGFTVAPGARLSDGRLTLSIYRRFSKFELMRHFLSISRGKYHYSPKIETYHAAELVLDSIAPLPVHLDGKPYGVSPVKVTSLHRALKVFAPQVRQPRPDEKETTVLPAPEEKNQEQRA